MVASRMGDSAWWQMEAGNRGQILSIATNAEFRVIMDTSLGSVLSDSKYAVFRTEIGLFIVEVIVKDIQTTQCSIQPPIQKKCMEFIQQ